MIVGCSGAGKSTLARRISEKTGLPVIHVDQIYWTAGWINRSREETRRLVAEAIAGDEWIFEGNNSRSFDLRVAKADTVIFLDFPVPLCLFRVIKRVVTGFGRVRSDMAEGCPEGVDWEFLKWIVGYKRNLRPEIIEMLDSLPGGVKVHHLRGPADVDGFLKTF
jgi:adenylate kinase family enzyme